MLSNFLLRLGHRLNGSRVFGLYKFLLVEEKSLMSDVLGYQQCRLTDLLRFCKATVPYYKEIIPDKELSGESLISNIFRKIPCLTKDMIRDNFDLLQPASKISSRGKWRLNSTGGSTGIPLKVYQDLRYSEWTRAAGYYFRGLCGVSPGEPYFVLWGSEKEFKAATSSLGNKISTFLHGRVFLPSFRMTDELMALYAKIINSQKKIQVLSGYLDSISMLARFIKTNGIQIRKLKCIQSCAGTLHPSTREYIQDVFGCKVLNLYGSRDGGTIASECGRQEGLHISSPTHYVEILRENGMPCEYGEPGEIVITHLENYAMPLIRYRTGDIGWLKKESCSCGRSYPLLGGVEGRIVEQLIASDGSAVSPLFFIHLIGVVLNPGFIKRFQVIQDSYKDMTIMVVLEDGSQAGFEGIREELEEKIKLLMGQEFSITWKQVSNIEPLPSGKYNYVINNIREGCAGKVAG